MITGLGIAMFPNRSRLGLYCPDASYSMTQPTHKLYDLQGKSYSIGGSTRFELSMPQPELTRDWRTSWAVNRNQPIADALGVDHYSKQFVSPRHLFGCNSYAVVVLYDGRFGMMGLFEGTIAVPPGGRHAIGFQATVGEVLASERPVVCAELKAEGHIQWESEEALSMMTGSSELTPSLTHQIMEKIL